MATTTISVDVLESLEISLDALGKALLRDIGELLHIPAKELIKKIYGSGNMKKIIVTHKQEKQEKQEKQQEEPLESHNNNVLPNPTNPCKALELHDNNAFYCNRPTKQKYCDFHINKIDSFRKGKPLQRISEQQEQHEQHERQFLTPEGVIINKEGRALGVVKDGIRWMF